METLSFHPRPAGAPADRISALLVKAARIALIAALGLFPIFFIPSVNAPFNFTKSLLVMTGVGIALILYAFSALRRRSLVISAPAAIYASWALAGVYALSAWRSGDMRDAFLGDMFGIYTAGFIILMVLIISAIYIIGLSKTDLKRLYLMLIASGVLLALFHLLRAVWGADFLALGVFTGTFQSPYGMWNELAIFFGLIVISGLVVIRQLPLSRAGISIAAAVAAAALAMLVLVNFFAIWVLVAAASALFLIGMLMDARHWRAPIAAFIKTDEANVTPAVVYTLAVFVVAIAFVIFNGSLGGAINSYTQTSYLEMRPSVSATFAVMKQVLHQDPILGIGPNKFIDAWRLYKDPAVNGTDFWDTSFAGGSGFVPTGFATVGWLGSAAWIAFLGLWLWQGVRVLFRPSSADPFWHMVGALSFLASVYLWIVAVIYTPSVPTLILLAVTTGTFLAVGSELVPPRRFSLPFLNQRLTQLLLIGIAIVVLCGTIAALRLMVWQYSAVYAYTKTWNMGDVDDRQEKWERVAAAYERSPNDVFARRIALGLLLTLDGMLNNTAAVDDGKRALFQDVASRAIQAGQLATKTDPTEPLNWVTLGQVYSELALARIDGAYEMGVQAYDTAFKYDPRNPSILLLKAQLESRHGDIAAARSLAEAAIQMKPNYADAFFFSAQLDIVEGKVADAIKQAQAVVSIDPQNPTWLYQLGTLYMSTADYTSAIMALERAVALDPHLANARYFLALALAESGDFQGALTQMREVEQTNPGNSLVTEAIAAFTDGHAVALPDSPLETAAIDGAATTTDDRSDQPPVTSSNSLNTGDNLTASAEGG